MGLTRHERARFALLTLGPAEVHELLRGAAIRVRLFDVDDADTTANELWHHALMLATRKDARSRTAEWLSHVVRELDADKVEQFVAFTAWLAGSYRDGVSTDRLRTAILCLGVQPVADLLAEVREEQAVDDAHPVREAIGSFAWRVRYHSDWRVERAPAAQLLADALALGGEPMLERIEAVVAEQQRLADKLEALHASGVIGEDDGAWPELRIPELPAATRWLYAAHARAGGLERRFG